MPLSTVGGKIGGKIRGVKFNQTKTVSLLYSRQEQPSNFSLNFGNSVISDSQSNKHLGVILNSTLSWDDHINYIISRVTPRLNIFRALKFNLLIF